MNQLNTILEGFIDDYVYWTVWAIREQRLPAPEYDWLEMRKKRAINIFQGRLDNLE